jgi:molecular chaperone DnaK
VKKQLGELGEQLPAAAKSEIEAAVAEVEEALKSDDTDRIRQTSEALQAKFGELAAAAQQAGAAGGFPGGAAPGGDDEAPAEPKRAKGDVVDAEFEEVGETKS